MTAAIDYDPYSPTSMADPNPAYRALREAGPVHPLPQYHGFALPRFAEVWDDPRQRSALRRLVMLQAGSEEFSQYFQEE